MNPRPRPRHQQEHGNLRCGSFVSRCAGSYTSIVMGLVILLLGGIAIATTPTDILPEVDIPVVSVIWNYGGRATEEMAARITSKHSYTD
jgi:Cu/Ag efflux pump CusA